MNSGQMDDLQQLWTELHSFSKQVRMPQRTFAELMSRLRAVLGYDFVIDENYPLQNVCTMISEDKMVKLGQVATPSLVARLIVELCLETPSDKVLEPCFGTGVFLISAFRRLSELRGRVHDENIGSQIFGVELDPVSFIDGIKNLVSETGIPLPRGNYFCGDLFDFRVNPVFDAVVMNPPYVRQEDLTSGLPFLNKDLIRQKCLNFPDRTVKLSARSNLYAYFFIQLSKFLKEGGRLGAITSNTWLDSSFGRGLQEFLSDEFQIEYIIDFDKDVFPDVAVEGCIVILRKVTEKSRHPTKFARIKERLQVEVVRQLLGGKEGNYEDARMRVVAVSDRTLRRDHKWSKFLWAPLETVSIMDNEMTANLSSLARVMRGITTNCNKFFMPGPGILKNYGIEKPLRQIIGSPKDLEYFDTTLPSVKSSILFIDEDDLGNPHVAKYVADWKEHLLKVETKSSLSKRVLEHPADWFSLPRLKSGPIIFSYILRANKSFILNASEIPVRDNFYIISPNNCDALLLFGILNSTLTKIMLEMVGRRYGQGLLKVQAYELEDMLVPDPRKMSEEMKKAISSLARQLSRLRLDDPAQHAIVSNIDSLLLDYLKTNLRNERLKQIENSVLSARLSRKGHSDFLDPGSL